MATIAERENNNTGKSKKRRFRLLYHRRLFLGLLIYSTAIFICFAFYQYNTEKRYKEQLLDTELQGVNTQIIQSLNHGMPPAEAAGNAASQHKHLRISIIARDGKILYDNTLDSLPGTNHLDRTEISLALKNEHGYTTRRHSPSTGQSYFYSATASNNYIVRTALPYDLSLTKALAPEYTFLWTLLIITVAMLLIGFIATRRLGKHISRLDNFAENAEKGLKINGNQAFPHDEIGQISQNIVRLYARLQQALADRDAEHRKALHATEEQNRIKLQLTNNINHELKTPVAAINICIETLRSHPELPEETRTELLERCDAACSRLTQLLSDISTITRLEDGPQNIESRDIDIAAIIHEVCNEFQPQAKASGFKIINTANYRGTLKGNTQLLSSVFRNLIANAIAYSGGDTISISTQLDSLKPGKLIINFSDNGCGVSPEHLPHLFERFYRIDKGRSRQAGGTGLGLAIVKNAIHWHKGTIEVHSKPESGLHFTIALPLPT